MTDIFPKNVGNEDESCSSENVDDIPMPMKLAIAMTIV